MKLILFVIYSLEHYFLTKTYITSVLIILVVHYFDKTHYVDKHQKSEDDKLVHCYSILLAAISVQQRIRLLLFFDTCVDNILKFLLEV